MALMHYTDSNVTHSSPSGIVGAVSVIGCKMVDRQGQHIGDLRDIMLDLSTGRIAYAVIDMGSRGSDAQLIVVPWNTVHPDHSTQLRVNAHADWIARAPTVQRGHALAHFVQEWGAFIHNYFGARPYWEATSTRQYS